MADAGRQLAVRTFTRFILEATLIASVLITVGSAIYLWILCVVRLAARIRAGP